MAVRDYLQYWRTRAAVFLSPLTDPHSQLFVTDAMKPEIERLRLFTHASQALLVVTAGPGGGKTTLLRWCQASYGAADHEVLTLAMVRREHQSGWLMPALCATVGLTRAAPSPETALARLAERFDQLADSGRKVVLAIDHAHLADGAEALQEVTALLGLTALAGERFAVLLFGEPKLGRTVAGATALAEATAFHLTLPPLAKAETAAYIDHRLRLAGVSAHFTAGAIDAIHARAAGAFGLTNCVAEAALIEACLRQTKKVTLEVAQVACRYGSLTSPQPVEAREVGVRPADLSTLFKLPATGND